MHAECLSDLVLGGGTCPICRVPLYAGAVRGPYLTPGPISDTAPPRLTRGALPVPMEPAGPGGPRGGEGAIGDKSTSFSEPQPGAPSSPPSQSVYTIMLVNERVQAILLSCPNMPREEAEEEARGQLILEGEIPVGANARDAFLRPEAQQRHLGARLERIRFARAEVRDQLEALQTQRLHRRQEFDLLTEHLRNLRRLRSSGMLAAERGGGVGGPETGRAENAAEDGKDCDEPPLPPVPTFRRTITDRSGAAVDNLRKSNVVTALDVSRAETYLELVARKPIDPTVKAQILAAVEYGSVDTAARLLRRARVVEMSRKRRAVCCECRSALPGSPDTWASCLNGHPLCAVCFVLRLADGRTCPDCSQLLFAPHVHRTDEVTCGGAGARGVASAQGGDRTEGGGVEEHGPAAVQEVTTSIEWGGEELKQLELNLLREMNEVKFALLALGKDVGQEQVQLGSRPERQPRHRSLGSEESSDSEDDYSSSNYESGYGLYYLLQQWREDLEYPSDVDETEVTAMQERMYQLGQKIEAYIDFREGNDGYNDLRQCPRCKCGPIFKPSDDCSDMEYHNGECPRCESRTITRSGMRKAIQERPPGQSVGEAIPLCTKPSCKAKGIRVYFNGCHRCGESFAAGWDSLPPYNMNELVIRQAVQNLMVSIQEESAALEHEKRILADEARREKHEARNAQGQFRSLRNLIQLEEFQEGAPSRSQRKEKRARRRRRAAAKRKLSAASRSRHDGGKGPG